MKNKHINNTPRKLPTNNPITKPNNKTYHSFLSTEKGMRIPCNNFQFSVLLKLRPRTVDTIPHIFATCPYIMYFIVPANTLLTFGMICHALTFSKPLFLSVLSALLSVQTNLLSALKS